jgi:hypothetical protein
MSESRYSLSKNTLIEISNYLGNQTYREVYSLISALDSDLRQENELSEKPLEYYNISSSMLLSLKKYLSSKPYGEVYKFMYELETAICVPNRVGDKTSNSDKHEQATTLQTFEGLDNADGSSE